MAELILRFDHSFSIEEKLIPNLSPDGNINHKKIIDLLLRYEKVFLSRNQERNIPESIYIFKTIKLNSYFTIIEKQILDPIKEDFINRLKTDLGLVYRFHDFAIKY